MLGRSSSFCTYRATKDEPSQDWLEAATRGEESLAVLPVRDALPVLVYDVSGHVTTERLLLGCLRTPFGN